jgi:hypothetical protein
MWMRSSTPSGVAERVVELRDAGIRLRYPATTPEGNAVDLDEVRLHLRSRDSDELYLEVSRHLGLDPGTSWERERRFVEARLGAVVDLPQPAVFNGRDALRYGFRWDGHQRVVHLVVIGEWLYRVIHDPAAPLAPAVLETIELG